MLIHRAVSMYYFDDEHQTMFRVFIFSDNDEATSIEQHRGYGEGTFWAEDGAFSFDVFAEAVKYYKQMGYEIDWHDIWRYEHTYRSNFIDEEKRG